MSPVCQLIRKKKLLSICIIWLLGFCFGSAELVFSRALPFEYGGQTIYDCRETFDDYWGRVFTLVVFAVTLAIPLMILTFVYSAIGFHIRKNGIPGNPDPQRDVNRENRRDKVVKLLVMIVVLFAVCWLPIHIFNLLVWFTDITKVKTKLQYRTYIWSFLACHFLSMAHSFVNPIVYCFMSKNFRVILFAIIKRKCPLNRCLRRNSSVT